MTLILLKYFLIFIIHIFFRINCEEIDSDNIPIELDVQYNSSLSSDDSYNFYKIKIPDNIKINTTDLVFRVKELDSADEGRTDFSDPDIYVSKVISKLYFLFKIPINPFVLAFKGVRQNSNIGVK